MGIARARRATAGGVRTDTALRVKPESEGSGESPAEVASGARRAHSAGGGAAGADAGREEERMKRSSGTRWAAALLAAGLVAGAAGAADEPANIVEYRQHAM